MLQDGVRSVINVADLSSFCYDMYHMKLNSYFRMICVIIGKMMGKWQDMNKSLGEASGK